MRLPDNYYTRKPLDSYYEPPGQPAPTQFYIGEDLVFDIYLVYEDKPVVPEDWTVKAFVKQNPYAEQVMWQGELLNGITELEPKGYYRILLKAEAVCGFAAGTYWLDIKGIRDDDGLDVVLCRHPFGLDRTASTTTPAGIAINSQLPKAVDITKI